MPRTSVTYYHRSHDSGEVMADPLGRVQDDSYEELHWRIRYTKKTETWEAKVVTPKQDGYDTFTIRGTGIPRLVRVSYKAHGLPRRAKAEHIASVQTFGLAVICAEDHYRRITNGRRRDAEGKQAQNGALK